jgi:hypothetical protein
MAETALERSSRIGKYNRTPEHRAATAAWNRENKRKYPVGYDTKSRLYRIWRAMHFRCYAPSHEAFPRYGGRGITVCSEWVTDYTAFMNWALANGYAPDLTIDREDNDLGYTPGNCRWITMRAQMINKRNNRPPLTMFGETKPVSDWGRDPRCATQPGIFQTRIGLGWDAEEAFLTPTQAHKGAIPVRITAFGETKGPEAWANDPRCRVGLYSLYYRAKRGWSGERIVTEPVRQSLPKGATQCLAGHEFTAENTAFEPSGRRRCRACMRAADAKRPPRSKKRRP